jgi:hypothetical protein
MPFQRGEKKKLAPIVRNNLEFSTIRKKEKQKNIDLQSASREKRLGDKIFTSIVCRNRDIHGEDVVHVARI